MNVRPAAASCRVLALVISCGSLVEGAPPDEVRVDDLATRGVVFHDERPGTFEEAVAGAGDVNGDGRADFLVLHQEETPALAQIVRSSRDAPIRWKNRRSMPLAFSNPIEPA